MKRSLFILAVSMLLLFAFIGCDNPANNFGPTNTTISMEHLDVSVNINEPQGDGEIIKSNNHFYTNNANEK